MNKEILLELGAISGETKGVIHSIETTESYETCDETYDGTWVTFC